MISPEDSPHQQFELAYDRYADAIFRHCYFRLSDRERGKDLMQETFMKAWKYVAAGKVIENVQAFLYKTANHLIIDEVRRNKRRPTSSLDEMQDEGFDVGTSDDAERMKKRIDENKILMVLDKLDPQYREVLLLRYIDEFQPAEIAEILSESPNAVSVRINRGLKQLRSLLPQ